jgi:hypothetical protein
MSMLFTTPLYLVAHPSADFDMTVWFGLVAPANTPRAIIERHRHPAGIVPRRRIHEAAMPVTGHMREPSRLTRR